MTPAVGQRIAGKYDLVRPLAHGGMGAIWVARHVELDVQVALKFMAERLLEREDGFVRFKREAQAAARLRSVHVTQIHDYGVHDGMPYIAMELLHGQDLSELLAQRGSLGTSEAVDIVRQVCIGLGHAHAAGIVHRDLKPANIFLSQSGPERVVKILDFGIAKQRAAELASGTASATGALIGSPLFMSPEQIRGEAVDHRSDLWSLGVVIYRMLTGHEPFVDEHVGRLFEAICRAEPVPPSHRVPQLGPALDAFMSRALERARTLRFQTADELSAAFAAAVAGDARPSALANVPDGRQTATASELPPGPSWPAPATPHSMAPMAVSAAPPVYHPPAPQPWIAPHPYAAYSPYPVHPPQRSSRWPWAVGAVGLLAIAAAAVLLVAVDGTQKGEGRSKPQMRDVEARPTVSPAASTAVAAPSATALSAPPAPRPTTSPPPAAVPQSGRKPPLGVVNTCWKVNEGSLSGTAASSATISAFVDANGRATSIRIEGPARQHKNFVACCVTRLSTTNWGRGEHESMSFSVGLPAGP